MNKVGEGGGKTIIHKMWIICCFFVCCTLPLDISAISIKYIQDFSRMSLVCHYHVSRMSVGCQ